VFVDVFYCVCLCVFLFLCLPPLWPSLVQHPMPTLLTACRLARCKYNAFLAKLVACVVGAKHAELWPPHHP